MIEVRWNWVEELFNSAPWYCDGYSLYSPIFIYPFSLLPILQITIKQLVFYLLLLLLRIAPLLHLINILISIHSRANWGHYGRCIANGRGGSVGIFRLVSSEDVLQLGFPALGGLWGGSVVVGIVVSHNCELHKTKWLTSSFLLNTVYIQPQLDEKWDIYILSISFTLDHLYIHHYGHWPV